MWTFEVISTQDSTDTPESWYSGNPVRGHGLWIFGFGDRGHPVGYSPSVFGSATYYDSEADTANLLRAFYRAWELALSQTASRRLIESLAKE